MGRFPTSVRVGVGFPVVTTVKLLAAYRGKLAWSGELKPAGASSVSVNDWTASGATPFDAVMVKLLV